MTAADIGVAGLQVGWIVLILSAPPLCARAARAVDLGGGQVLLAAGIAIAAAAVITWHRPDEPLHNNGHAWLEAREVLLPWGGRADGTAPFMHGPAGIALQWLVAAVERTITGAADPFRISRLGVAAAAGAGAFLVAVLVRSAPAGLAAGCIIAFTPLARSVAVSGSALAIPAMLLPWALGLAIAAGRSGDRTLFAGAALATALGSLSHTAMLAWPPAITAATAMIAPRRWRRDGVIGVCLLAMAGAWLAESVHCYGMLAERSEGHGLLTDAWLGVLRCNLFLDRSWVSPLIAIGAAAWIVAGMQRAQRATVAATGLAAGVASVPFFAVAASSSDAIRYQGALLPLVASMATAGLWQLPALFVGGRGLGAARIGLLALAPLTAAAAPPPNPDPVTVEHRLVVDAVRRMEPGTVVRLPPHRLGNVIVDFPDFLLPPGSSVLFADEGSTAATAHRELIYLGLACLSCTDEHDASTGNLRPECAALRGDAQPWLVASLDAEDLPRHPDGQPWTLHRLTTGVPFGFFVPRQTR